MSNEADDRSSEPESKDSLWLPAGFFCLGGSVGFVSGLSDAAVTLPLIAALLALIGGGFIPFFSKINHIDRTAVGQLLCAFTISFTLAIFLGIAVKVNNLIILEKHSNNESGAALNGTPGGGKTANENQMASANHNLLKSEEGNRQLKLEALCHNRDYDALYDALKEGR